MDKTLQTHLDNLWTTDRDAQNAAYAFVMQAAEQPVDWAYAVWDVVVANLTHADNHNRAIAGQLLSRLAISDPDGRILKDFKALLNVTRDERFVTARHTMQSIWRVGLAGEEHRTLLLKGLKTRYDECAKEKNGALTRYDIHVTMRALHDAVSDEKFKISALAWIELESDPKLRKKYAGAWKKKR
ncbi:MAG: hypothetical protein EPO32_06550 [Anaerolineae bacterium]|nr:MAG: hypothetical protein EPO32_06550 [Anaerolineae bacterium]